MFTNKLLKKLRREPRGYTNFERMYGGIKRKYSIASLGRLQIDHSRAQNVARKLSNILANKTGDGTVILAPLGTTLTAGEFAKGFFKIVAPKARVSLLVTPAADEIGAPLGLGARGKHTWSRPAV